jgi:hypothetical protein
MIACILARKVATGTPSDQSLIPRLTKAATGLIAASADKGERLLVVAAQSTLDDPALAIFASITLGAVELRKVILHARIARDLGDDHRLAAQRLGQGRRV